MVALGRDIRHHLDAMEAWASARGPLGWVATVALFVVSTSALFPESALSITAGALFGLWEGMATVVVARLLRGETKLQTLTPLNPASISYAMGAAGVRFPGFILACVLSE